MYTTTESSYDREQSLQETSYARIVSNKEATVFLAKTEQTTIVDKSKTTAGVLETDKGDASLRFEDELGKEGEKANLNQFNSVHGDLLYENSLDVGQKGHTPGVNNSVVGPSSMTPG